MARDTVSFPLIPAGEGTKSAFFRSAVLSVFPFATRTTKSPSKAGDAAKMAYVGYSFKTPARAAVRSAQAPMNAGDGNAIAA